MRKLNILWRYTKFGLKFGADLRSQWLLATMLPRLRIAQCLAISEFNEHIYHVVINLRGYRFSVLLRPQDIFIMYEVLADNLYIPVWLKRNPPKCILDLGAHIGLATLQFKAHFPEAVVHCFEPDPDNFRLLKANTQSLDGVLLHQEAVGAVSGESMLYIQPGRHSASSLVPPEGRSKAIKCRIVALDKILENLSQVDFIKFDIEGMEYEVFSASKLVHSVPLIVGEIKANERSLRRFLSLFSYDKAQVQSINAKMHFVYLWQNT